MADNYREALYLQYVADHQGVLPEAANRPRMAQDVLAHLPAPRDTRILDVGCGQGMLVRFLLGQGYSEVRGIDVSAEQVALAHDLGTPAVEVGDLFAFSADNPGAFDAVVALDVVEHFDRADVQDVFSALGRLLRPGGMLILRTPNGGSPYSGRYQFSDLTHGVIYTDRSLEQVCAATGFEAVRVYPVRPAGSGGLQRVRRVLWRAIEAAFVVPLIVETGRVRGHIVTQNLVCTATTRST
jgi:2-polyprenyl-3-methyl-5-hydroxy-6-metoxy-1,4-benzoquinol methylase